MKKALVLLAVILSGCDSIGGDGNIDHKASYNNAVHICKDQGMVVKNIEDTGRHSGRPTGYSDVTCIDTETQRVTSNMMALVLWKPKP